MEKLGKLIPAEVVAGYEMLSGFVPGVNPESWRAGFYWLAFVIGLVCTPLYMLWQSERGRPRASHIALSTGSFVVWAYALSGMHLLPGNLYQESLAGIVLVAYSLLIGFKKLRK
jgi:hypothetical protein